MLEMDVQVVSDFADFAVGDDSECDEIQLEVTLKSAVSEINRLEAKLLKRLFREADIIPPTPFDWLKIFLQNIHRILGRDVELLDTGGPDADLKQWVVHDEFFAESFDGRQFRLSDLEILATLLDDLVLDYGHLKFPYSLVAASVIHVTNHYDASIIERATGYSVAELETVAPYICTFKSFWTNQKSAPSSLESEEYTTDDDWDDSEP
ncbi:hypothetical protein HK405_009000, partial [Cladochytrium tenue]